MAWGNIRAEMYEFSKRDIGKKTGCTMSFEEFKAHWRHVVMHGDHFYLGFKQGMRDGRLL